MTNVYIVKVNPVLLASYVERLACWLPTYRRTQLSARNLRARADGDLVFFRHQERARAAYRVLEIKLWP